LKAHTTLPQQFVNSSHYIWLLESTSYHPFVMAPDLNSLPPSRSTSSSPLQARSHQSQPAMDPASLRRETPSPRSASMSLAAAASMNAAEVSRRNSNTSNSRGSPRAGRAGERRRSIVVMNINHNDPSLPSPGELPSSDRRSSISNQFSAASPSTLAGASTIATGDPHHHHRAPSLGELHQELEQEQEAQVNRLLQMIRSQQLQLEQMQRYHQDQASRSAQSHPGPAGVNSSNIAIIDDSTPTSERSFSFQPLPLHQPQPQPLPPRRRPSRPSAGTSPALRPLPTLTSTQSQSQSSSGDFGPPSPLEIARRTSSRDETAFYQAETANLTRENQMLRLRIRELERQLSDANPNSTAPATPSHLAMTRGGVEGEKE
jgi:hypothetical protein